MRQLRVALFVKPSPATVRREDRNMGYWSYAVPEFTWDHFPHNNQRVDLAQFKDYDLIFHEDAGFCTYDNLHAGPPVVYLAIDSTLSHDHYLKRLEQAKQAHVVLVDHDKTSRFKAVNKRTFPFPFCVNDHVFSQNEKYIDLVNHCSSGSRSGMPGAKERSEMRGFLSEYADQNGYSYKSGAVGLDEYAADMGNGKVVVNWPRTLINRPHRVFDSMACGAALVTGHIPWVEGDGIEDGRHYLGAEDWREFPAIIDRIIGGEWEQIAEAGHTLVMENHTWEIRAQQLRILLQREFGI